MRTSSTRDKAPQLKNFAEKTAAILFWLAVWQGVYMLVGQEILVASPAAVFVRLTELVREPFFWMDTGGSLLRILAGFAIAVGTGTILAACAHRFSLFASLFQPVISVVKATPVASFIILALVWMKSGNMPVLISMLMVLPGVYIGVLQGIRSTDPGLLEMASVFRVSGWKMFTKIYIPSVIPYFMAACTTGLGLAWKAGIAAEVLGNTVHSIGGQIYDSKIYLETVDLFSWTLIVIFLSIAIEKVVLGLIKKIAFYRKETGGEDEHGRSA